MTNRRELMTLLGAAVSWPLAAPAQQSAMPVIGFLHQGSAAANGKAVGAFLRGLQDAGYADGLNVRLEFRWADGRYERLDALAAELVRLRPAVIAAALLPAAQAARAATSSIPIVFISGSDPVETGLVASVGRPIGNVTGVSLFSVPRAAARAGARRNRHRCPREPEESQCRIEPTGNRRRRPDHWTESRPYRRRR
jgi:putative ABC transport system substrate-binding protein